MSGGAELDPGIAAALAAVGMGAGGGAPPPSSVVPAKVRAFFRAKALAEGAASIPAPPDEVLPAPDLTNELVEWAAMGVQAARRFALDCACGTGRMTGALLAKGLPTIAVDLVPEAAALAARRHRNPPACMVACGDAAKLPFRERSFGAIVDAGSFRHYADPEGITKEWARVLAPRGTVVLSEVVEKDADETGFLTSLESAMRPGVVNFVYKPFELTYFLETAGLVVEKASYWRYKRSFARLDAEVCAPAGVSPEGYRRLLANATPELRELYEIKEEEMVWRVVAIQARKR